MNIYVTGPVGTSGALKLYKEQYPLFEARFPAFFRSQIESMERVCDRIDNSQITLAKSDNCIYICEVTDGGLFGALWEGCEKLKCGCEVFLERIPIRQETVEITELTGDNPYEIDSFGDLLIFLNKDAADFDLSDAADFHLHCIGRTTAEKDRVILYNGKKRFLTPPARQQTDIAARKSARSVK